MNILAISKVLCAIHQREFGAVPDQYQEVISAIFYDYGIERDDDVPGWFCEIIAAVSCRQNKEFSVPSYEDPVGGILCEIREAFGWDFVDDGEWWSLTFPKSGVEVYVSREGRDATCKCTITVA